MAKGGPEAHERLNRAAQAKNELVSHYLHLGTAMKRCSQAVENYAHALNEAKGSAEMVNLLRAPLGTAMPVGMGENLPFLGFAGAGNETVSGSKKRSKSEDSDDGREIGPDGKKKRKSKKKERDPDAPKRPASAYIIFQNQVREEVKTNNPGLPYGEILQMVSERWKQLGEDAQKPYKDNADKAMAEWREKQDTYLANKDANATIADADNAAVQQELIKPKKEKKAKKEAAGPAPAAAPSAAEVPPSAALNMNGKKEAPATAKKESKKPTSAALAAGKATTSTPVQRNVSPPKPAASAAPASSKKNAPQTAAESSSEEESTSEDDDSDESESE